MPNEWAPVVYGRTLRADYRTNLIAVPDGFGPAEIEWARTAADAVLTRDGERWVVFGDARFRVVGLACPARAASADRCADEFGRPIRVFLGWACRAPFAPLPPRDPELFLPLYAGYLLPRWDEDPALGTWNRVVPHPFARTLPAAPGSPGSKELHPAESAQLLAWPEEDADELWLVASRTAGPVSLAIGFHNLDQVARAPFRNVTVPGLGRPQWVEPAVRCGESLPVPPAPVRPPPPPPSRDSDARAGRAEKPAPADERPGAPECEPERQLGFIVRGVEWFFGLFGLHNPHEDRPRRKRRRSQRRASPPASDEPPEAHDAPAPDEPAPGGSPPCEQPKRKRFRWVQDSDENPEPPAEK